MPQDLTKFGLIPEFIGRVPVTVAPRSCRKTRLLRFFSEPKNAIIKQYQAFFDLDGVKLEFTEEALTATPIWQWRKTEPEDCVPSWNRLRWISCMRFLQIPALGSAQSRKRQEEKGTGTRIVKYSTLQIIYRAFKRIRQAK